MICNGKHDLSNSLKVPSCNDVWYKVHCQPCANCQVIAIWPVLIIYYIFSVY